MANEITTTSLNDLVDTLLADAIFQFKRTGVMPSKVRRQSLLGFPGKQVISFGTAISELDFMG